MYSRYRFFFRCVSLVTLVLFMPSGVEAWTFMPQQAFAETPADHDLRLRLLASNQVDALESDYALYGRKTLSPVDEKKISSLVDSYVQSDTQDKTPPAEELKLSRLTDAEDASLQAKNSPTPEAAPPASKVEALPAVDSKKLTDALKRTAVKPDRTERIAGVKVASSVPILVRELYVSQVPVQGEGEGEGQATDDAAYALLAEADSMVKKHNAGHAVAKYLEILDNFPLDIRRIWPILR